MACPAIGIAMAALLLTASHVVRAAQGPLSVRLTAGQGAVILSTTTRTSVRLGNVSRPNESPDWLSIMPAQGPVTSVCCTPPPSPSSGTCATERQILPGATRVDVIGRYARPRLAPTTNLGTETLAYPGIYFELKQGTVVRICVVPD
jgi:hypothetical protein